MTNEKQTDMKLAQGFKDSLRSALGDSASEALIRFGKIPEDRLDAQGIESTFNVVFGASPSGLSAVQKNVLEGTSSRLGVDLEKADEFSGKRDFYISLVGLAERYRIKEMSGFGFAGLIASLISSACCLGPVAFALLGFSSMSAMITLADSMMYVYEPYELALAVAFLGTIIYFQLRKRNECNISGLRRNIGYVIIPAVTMLVSYALIAYFVGIAFYGWPLHLLPG
ncbi:MAG TPA: hypothetical protein VEC08_03680 [Nitrososphaerales archaeon]|nr:hypothetical protein [Nitrososphaerales archaeon]